MTLDALDARIGAIVTKIAAEGVEAADLARAKTRLVADAIYAQDSQATLARWYGAALASGQTIADITAWPDRIEAVTVDDVKAACVWLEQRRAVTGYLLPLSLIHI